MFRSHIYLINLVLILFLGSACNQSPTTTDRHDLLRKVIIDNLHIGPHLNKATDLRTIEALRANVSSSDIPILTRLLSDKKAAVAVTSQILLIDFGNESLAHLQQVRSSDNPRAKILATEAIQIITEGKEG